MFRISITCKYCKDSVIIQDRVTYEHICIECGLVVEDSRICDENMKLQQAMHNVGADIENNKIHESFLTLKTFEIAFHEQNSTKDKRFKQLREADGLLYNISSNFGLENAFYANCFNFMYQYYQHTKNYVAKINMEQVALAVFILKVEINPEHDVNLSYLKKFTNEKFNFEKVFERKRIIQRTLPQFRTYYKIDNYIETIGKRLSAGQLIIKKQRI